MTHDHGNRTRRAPTIASTPLAAHFGTSVSLPETGLDEAKRHRF
jgi:hypothetical protein